MMYASDKISSCLTIFQQNEVDVIRNVTAFHYIYVYLNVYYVLFPHVIVLTISEITLLIVYSTAYEMSFKMTICAHSAFVQSGFHVQRHCKTSRYLDVCILCTLIVHLYKYLSFLPYLHIYRLYYLYTICDCAISIYLIKRTHLKIALNKTVIKFYPQMNLLHIFT